MRIIKKYDNFVNENMEMAKSIIAKKMDAFDKLKTLLSKNIGYIGKFTEYLMDENIGYSDLEVLYKDLMELKSKNNPLDITKLSYEKVTDKIISTNNNILVNGLLKQFPSEQRKLIGDNVDFYFNILLKVAKKDGSTAIWVISGAPTFDMKGKVRGSIGIHWDVTEIRKLENKLLLDSVKKEKELMEAKNYQTLQKGWDKDIRLIQIC